MTTYDGESNSNTTPGVKGGNTAALGVGVWGESSLFEGVHAIGHGQAAGVGGYNDNAQGGPGVWGESQHWEGVHGLGHDRAAGVAGVNDSTVGGAGVWGESQHWEGVHGISHAQTAGVGGYNDNAQGGPGVWGESQHFEGVHGIGHDRAAGVAGVNDSTVGGAGVWGESQHFEGVHGISHARAAGIAGYNDSTGAGVYGENTKGQGPAGFFQGNVVVTGDIQLPGSDCAEQFNIVSASICDPGTVMVIDKTGALIPSYHEYDRCVAGVISGAGGVRPGVILGEKPATAGRRPIALIGTVYCKAVALDAPIEVGDLLTTSALAGHAMKAADPLRSFGAVLGKALGALNSGTGLIPVLVVLQ